jgi:hypothetical protein
MSALKCQIVLQDCIHSFRRAGRPSAFSPQNDVRFTPESGHVQRN